MKELNLKWKERNDLLQRKNNYKVNVRANFLSSFPHKVTPGIEIEVPNSFKTETEIFESSGLPGLGLLTDSTERHPSTIS